MGVKRGKSGSNKAKKREKKVKKSEKYFRGPKFNLRKNQTHQLRIENRMTAGLLKGDGGGEAPGLKVPAVEEPGS